jgi:hypothetical protein
LLIDLELVAAIDLLGLLALIAVQVQQKQFGQGICPLLNFIIAGELTREELNTVFIRELQLVSF